MGFRVLVAHSNHLGCVVYSFNKAFLKYRVKISTVFNWDWGFMRSYYVSEASKVCARKDSVIPKKIFFDKFRYLLSRNCDSTTRIVLVANSKQSVAELIYIHSSADNYFFPYLHFRYFA